MKTKPRKNGSARQSWNKFRAHKRGYFAFLLLAVLYALSLCAELVCNNRPLFLRHNGRAYFPALVNYTQHQILGNNVHTRVTDYNAICTNAATTRVIQPLFNASPNHAYSPDILAQHRRLIIDIAPDTKAAALQITQDGSLLYTLGDADAFPDILDDVQRGTASALLRHPDIAAALAARFTNKAPSPLTEIEFGGAIVTLPPHTPAFQSGSAARINLRQKETGSAVRKALPPAKALAYIQTLSYLTDADRRECARVAESVAAGNYEPPLAFDGMTIRAELETVSWPFRPVRGHIMGFDSGGFDVFARVFYAMRVSMTFGLLLVCATMLLGIIAGAVQGYFAGWVDLTGQRLTEIWSALPFLYIIILLGNTLGRSFMLLLICYAVFNWIGVATYTRAEFLRLRTRAFVDAARCQGLSSRRIMFRHILPNSLTPLIALFPFSLVAAVSSLAALDYLGFGLPDTVPSWGELLRQAQSFRDAWWLILYPSIALFIVMILGVFIGEGLRDALDPKPYSRME